MGLLDVSTECRMDRGDNAIQALAVGACRPSPWRSSGYLPIRRSRAPLAVSRQPAPRAPGAMPGSGTINAGVPGSGGGLGDLLKGG